MRVAADRPTVEDMRRRYEADWRDWDMGETNTPRSRRTSLAARVYSLMTHFKTRWFDFADYWQVHHEASHDTANRNWRLLTAALASERVPHEWDPETFALRFTKRTSRWVNNKAGAVCWDCGDLFEPRRNSLEDHLADIERGLPVYCVRCDRG